MLEPRVQFWWRSGHDAPQAIEGAVFELLQAIGQEGSLRRAARTVGLSYRHAWALIGKWGALCAQPLVQLERGRGATLTSFGEKLLTARQRTSERLTPQLGAIAAELARELSANSVPALLRIHASHDLALVILRDLLGGDPALQIDLQFQGSLDSLASLARGRCDVAGFHLPVDPHPGETVAAFRRWLKPRAQKLIHFVSRQQGLMLAAGNPHGIRGLSDLARKKVRFINRQHGSGTRVEFDRLLVQMQIDPRHVAGYETEEFTHLAVAATIAGGMADVGFGIRAAAARFGLDFIPLLSERYFLVCRSELIDQPALQKLIAALHSERFRAAVAALPGYELSDSGNISTINDILPASHIMSRPARAPT